ncbi:MAG: PspC domain-containing protein [Candidatus Paceibacterota bacterium]|jgi:phage shock protein C
MKKLYRSRKNRMLAGVLGGFGEYFGVDPTVFRVAWVVISVFSGFFPGIIAYFLAVLIVSEEPQNNN